MAAAQLQTTNFERKRETFGKLAVESPATPGVSFNKDDLLMESVRAILNDIDTTINIPMVARGTKVTADARNMILSTNLQNRRDTATAQFYQNSSMIPANTSTSDALNKALAEVQQINKLLGSYSLPMMPHISSHNTMSVGYRQVPGHVRGDISISHTKAKNESTKDLERHHHVLNLGSLKGHNIDSYVRSKRDIELKHDEELLFNQR